MQSNLKMDVDVEIRGLWLTVLQTHTEMMAQLISTNATTQGLQQSRTATNDHFHY